MDIFKQNEGNIQPKRKDLHEINKVFTPNEDNIYIK